jgi:hypothetical protein
VLPLIEPEGDLEMSDVVTTQMRFPADVWAWLGSQSAAHVRSRNGEITFMLRQRMAQEQEAQQHEAVQR